MSNALFHLIHQRAGFLVLSFLALLHLRLPRQLSNLDTLLAEYTWEAILLRQQPIPLVF
jgi:hypothetical protein